MYNFHNHTLRMHAFPVVFGTSGDRDCHMHTGRKEQVLGVGALQSCVQTSTSTSTATSRARGASLKRQPGQTPLQWGHFQLCTVNGDVYKTWCVPVVIPVGSGQWDQQCSMSGMMGQNVIQTSVNWTVFDDVLALSEGHNTHRRGASGVTAVGHHVTHFQFYFQSGPLWS